MTEDRHEIGIVRSSGPSDSLLSGVPPPMYRPTNPQVSLFECQFLVPPAKRRRLEASWAHPFQQRVLPLIDEELFRECFSENNGRPNTSVRLLTGLHLLKEWNDLTDEQVLEQFEFNLQWQYALGVEPEHAHACQKTLHNYRVRLMGNERAQRAFVALTQGLVEIDGLDVGRQRLDSTHVISNIAVLTRLGLFVETTTKFLRELQREVPSKLAQLDGGYTERYLDREGYFADATREQARRRLPTVAVDIYRLVQAFAQDEGVSQLESYRLLKRLFEEQCEIVENRPKQEAPIKLIDKSPAIGEAEARTDGHEAEATSEQEKEAPVAAESGNELGESAQGNEEAQSDASCAVGPDVPSVVQEAETTMEVRSGEAAEESAPKEEVQRPDDRAYPVKLREAKEISSASLQSPHDPDATYGRKGKGYEIQVAETCGEGNPYQVVTGVSVNGAHESDQHAVIPMVDQLRDSQLMPSEMLADTGYGSGQNIIDCAERGVDLQAPVQDPDAPERADHWDNPVDPEPSGACSPGATAEETRSSTESAEAPLGLEAFAFNKTFDKVLHCPANHAPTDREFGQRPPSSPESSELPRLARVTPRVFGWWLDDIPKLPSVSPDTPVVHVLRGDSERLAHLWVARVLVEDDDLFASSPDEPAARCEETRDEGHRSHAVPDKVLADREEHEL